MTQGLFDGGPPLRIERWLRLRAQHGRGVWRSAFLVGVICWLPLAALSAASGMHTLSDVSFLDDVAAHARYLLAVPLFMLAEIACIPRLGFIAQHFVESGLVPEAERERFAAAVASTTRLRDSIVVEIAVVALAYFAVWTLMSSAAPYPSWHVTDGAGWQRFTTAGWWHLLVSLPILLILLLGWLWRLVLWARFLWLMSRLSLRLVPAHPDGMAGLQFVGHSVRVLALLAFATAVIPAGTIANRVLLSGDSPLAYVSVVVSVVLLVICLFAGPLLVFVGQLMQQRRRGVFQYGSLATRVGQEFENVWVRDAQGNGEDPLKAQAFSATTDLFQVVANVYRVGFVPLDLRSLVWLALATIAPFLPLLLLIAPLDELLKRIVGFLL